MADYSEGGNAQNKAINNKKRMWGVGWKMADPSIFISKLSLLLPESLLPYPKDTEPNYDPTYAPSLQNYL